MTMTILTLECPTCQKSFNHKGHFNEHLLIHSEEKNHRCTICEKAFRRSGQLRDHLRIHEPKQFICHCGKQFTYKSNLTQHQKRHDKSPSIKKRVRKNIEVLCGLCFEKILMSEMDAHLTSEHSSTEVPVSTPVEKGKRFFTCPYEICGKKFVSNYNLTSHIDAIHFQLKKYQCTTCEKSFGFKSALIRHQKLHLKILEIKCPLCLDPFDKLDKLSEHMTVSHGRNNLTGDEILEHWYGLVDNENEEIIDIC